MAAGHGASATQLPDPPALRGIHGSTDDAFEVTSAAMPVAPGMPLVAAP